MLNHALWTKKIAFSIFFCPQPSSFILVKTPMNAWHYDFSITDAMYKHFLKNDFA